MALVLDHEIDTFLESHPDWSRSGNELIRMFTFKDFNESMGFVTRIAMAAEKADHHPDIDIRWNKVKCVLSTHSQGTLTSKDLALAASFDGFA